MGKERAATVGGSCLCHYVCVWIWIYFEVNLNLNLSNNTIPLLDISLARSPTTEQSESEGQTKKGERRRSDVESNEGSDKGSHGSDHASTHWSPSAKHYLFTSNNLKIDSPHPSCSLCTTIDIESEGFAVYGTPSRYTWTLIQDSPAQRKMCTRSLRSLNDARSIRYTSNPRFYSGLSPAAEDDEQHKTCTQHSTY